MVLLASSDCRRRGSNFDQLKDTALPVIIVTRELRPDLALLTFEEGPPRGRSSDRLELEREDLIEVVQAAVAGIARRTSGHRGIGHHPSMRSAGRRPGAGGSPHWSVRWFARPLAATVCVPVRRAPRMGVQHDGDRTVQRFLAAYV